MARDQDARRENAGVSEGMKAWLVSSCWGEGGVVNIMSAGVEFCDNESGAVAMNVHKLTRANQHWPPIMGVVATELSVPWVETLLEAMKADTPDTTHLALIKTEGSA